MATVTAYWHKGGGWWTVRVNDQRATVRGKAAAAAAAAVMQQTEREREVEQAARAMIDAADRANAAYRAGADDATRAALRAAHSVARSEWFQARAAAGDTMARAMIILGAG